MLKHRYNCFTVVREEFVEVPHEYEGWKFSAIVGTYQSLNRAEEVVGVSAQAFRDAGVADGMYQFNVKVNTYYDE